MAGSYNHIVDRRGNLLDNERFVGMIETLGDAYEMAEQLYGMVWWLAFNLELDAQDAREVVEQARLQYRRGLEFAREANAR
jgi:hypothetical protein